MTYDPCANCQDECDGNDPDCKTFADWCADTMVEDNASLDATISAISARSWRDSIKLNRGEIGGTINGNPTTEMIDGCWFYRRPEDGDKKPIRDRIARAMRKDGWTVKTETNSLGWFLRATRKKEE